MNKRLRPKVAINAAANIQTDCLLYLLQNHFWRLNFVQFRENQTQHLVHNKMEWYWQEQPWRRVRKATLQSWLIIMKTRGGDDLLTASDRSGLLIIRLPLHRNSQGAEFHAGKQNCLFHLPPVPRHFWKKHSWKIHLEWIIKGWLGNSMPGIPWAAGCATHNCAIN